MIEIQPNHPDPNSLGGKVFRTASGETWRVTLIETGFDKNATVFEARCARVNDSGYPLGTASSHSITVMTDQSETFDAAQLLEDAARDAVAAAEMVTRRQQAMAEAKGEWGSQERETGQ